MALGSCCYADWHPTANELQHIHTCSHIILSGLLIAACVILVSMLCVSIRFSIARVSVLGLLLQQYSSATLISLAFWNLLHAESSTNGPQLVLMQICQSVSLPDGAVGAIQP